MKKVAILLENMFDEQELIYPYHRLREDFDVYLVGSEKDTEYKSKSGFKIKSHLASKDLDPDEFLGVFVPGGFSPDYMRANESTVEFVKKLDQDNKPVATICHGGWMLVESCNIKDKNVTSVKSIKTDLINAGGKWVDEEVVVDGNIISGRTPKDLPAVVKAFVKAIS